MRAAARPTPLSARSWKRVLRSKRDDHSRKRRRGRRAERTRAFRFLTSGCYQAQTTGCASCSRVPRIGVPRIRNRRVSPPPAGEYKVPTEYLFPRRCTSGHTRGKSGAASIHRGANREDSLRCRAGLGKGRRMRAAVGRGQSGFLHRTTGCRNMKALSPWKAILSQSKDRAQVDRYYGGGLSSESAW